MFLVRIRVNELPVISKGMNNMYKCLIIFLCLKCIFGSVLFLCNFFIQRNCWSFTEAREGYIHLRMSIMKWSRKVSFHSNLNLSPTFDLALLSPIFSLCASVLTKSLCTLELHVTIQSYKLQMTVNI